MLETTEMGVHWRVRPREAVSAGTGICSALVLWPYYVECLISKNPDR